MHCGKEVENETLCVGHSERNPLRSHSYTYTKNARIKGPVSELESESLKFTNLLSEVMVTFSS